jgi:hypothetical protein
MPIVVSESYQIYKNVAVSNGCWKGVVCVGVRANLLMAYRGTL